MAVRTSKVDVTIFEPSGGETVMYLRGHFKKGQGIMRIGDEKTGQVVAYSNRDEQSERKVCLGSLCVRYARDPSYRTTQDTML